ncbi:hypothetical protein D3C86_2201360 [compost metagenome]
MEQLVDVNFIYEKENEFNPELVQTIDPYTYKIPDNRECSLEENLEQFIYWYKTYLNRRNNINDIIS